VNFSQPFLFIKLEALFISPRLKTNPEDKIYYAFGKFI